MTLSASFLFRALSLVVAGAIALGVTHVSTTAHAQAPAAGARMLVLVPAGDARLAAQLGPGARTHAGTVLERLGFVAARGPASCTEPECASTLLEGGAADYTVAIALWGRGASCERVAITIADARGVSHGGEVAVADGDVDAALEGAIAAALEHAASGGGAILRITGAPEGATITLDRIPWGGLPHEDRVARGEHALAVSADGYETDRRTITVGGEPITLEVRLRAVGATSSLAPDGQAAQGTLGERAGSPVLGATAGAAPDPLLLGLGGGLAGVGLAAVGVSIHGLLTPPSAPMGPADGREQPALEASAAWLAVGGTLVVTGVVLLIVGATSSGRPATTASARGAGPLTGAVISF